MKEPCPYLTKNKKTSSILRKEHFIYKKQKFTYETYQYKHFKGTKLCLSSKNYNFVNKIIYRIIHSVIQATRLVKK